MADNIDRDEIILEDAKDALFSLEKELRRAINNNALDTLLQLRPQVEAAAEQFSLARVKLLQAGTVADDNDVQEMRRIRAEIDQAATTQTLIEGAVRFIAFIARFA